MWSPSNLISRRKALYWNFFRFILKYTDPFPARLKRRRGSGPNVIFQEKNAVYCEAFLGNATVLFYCGSLMDITIPTTVCFLLA